MGQKVNPHGLRVGINKGWTAKWYADKANFADFLVEDDNIRKFIKKKYYESAISKIVIERNIDKITINIHTGRPAFIIGKAGLGSGLYNFMPCYFGGQFDFGALFRC